MKIMVCTDGSELSKKAIEAAIGVAKPLEAELIGMTAVKGTAPAEGLAGESQDIQALAPSMKRQKLKIFPAAC